MSPEQLVRTPVTELVDLINLPRGVQSVEEETIVLAELCLRILANGPQILTTGQRLAICRKIDERRRLYNFQCIMALCDE